MVEGQCFGGVLLATSSLLFFHCLHDSRFSDVGSTLTQLALETRTVQIIFETVWGYPPKETSLNTKIK